MPHIQCKRISCKRNVRSIFYGHVCNAQVINVGQSGKCTSFEKDDPDNIKDKKLNKLPGYHKEQREKASSNVV